MSLHLTEDIKDIKEYHDKFSLKIDDQEKKLTSFKTSYDERFSNISKKNRVGNK